MTATDYDASGTPKPMFPGGWMVPVVALLLALFLACSREQKPRGKPGLTAPSGPDQVFVDSRFVVTDNGLTSAIVRAESVMVYQVRQLSEIAGNVQVDFFNRKGEKTSILTAKHGIIYGMTEAIDSLRAEGDVTVIWRERNATMKTSFIRWIESNRMIYADSTVTLTVENAVEQGVGFEAPDDLKSYAMRAVTGVVQSESIKIPRVPGGK